MPVNLLFVNNQLLNTIIEKEVIVETIETINKQVKHLLNIDCDTTKNKMEELDLEVKIQIIQSFINNLNEIKNETIQLCLKNIKLIIDKLSKELNEIKSIREDHKNKWFSNYRIPDYEKNFLNLQKYTNIFNQRIDLLFKIKN